MFVLYFILIFTGIISVHELGHYLFAKLFGVKVLEFAFGFGPKIFAIKGKETTFRFNLIPFGGYVKLLGEEENIEVAEEDVGRRYYDKPAFQRLLISLAGPLFSILAGYFLFIVIVGVWGVPVVGIGSVEGGSPAERAGLLPGDVILKINGKSVYDTMIVSQEIRKGGEVTFTILRNGEKMDLKVTPHLVDEEYEITLASASGTPSKILTDVSGRDISPNVLEEFKGEFVTLNFDKGKVSGVLKTYYYTPKRYIIGIVFAGLSNEFEKDFEMFKKGDVILSVGDQRVNGWLDLVRIYQLINAGRGSMIIQLRGKRLEWWGRGFASSVSVVIERDGRILRLNVPRGIIKNILEVPGILKMEAKKMRPKGLDIVTTAVSRCNYILVTSWKSLGRIFSGLRSGEIVGPVGIAGIVGEATKAGLEAVLSIVAIITMSLGIFNLLPLPALDGGKIVFSIIEIVTRKRVNPALENLIHLIGFIFLMILMIYITMMDIGRLIGR